MHWSRVACLAARNRAVRRHVLIEQRRVSSRSVTSRAAKASSPPARRDFHSSVRCDLLTRYV